MLVWVEKAHQKSTGKPDIKDYCITPNFIVAQNRESANFAKI